MSERIQPSVEQKFPELEKGSVHHGRLMKAYQILEERRRQQKLTEVRTELRQIQEPVERIPAETRPTEQKGEWKQASLLPMEGVVFERGRK